MKQKLEKWLKWIGSSEMTGSICCELINLANIRKVQYGLQEMVSSNPNLNKPSLFYSVEQSIYAQSVLLYIRRQVSGHRDSISLIDLLKDLKFNCHIISREYYCNIYTNGKHINEIDQWEALGIRDFKKFEKPDANHLNPLLIESFIETLESIDNKSKEFIDRRLAHLDKKSPGNLPTYGEIEEWCDKLNEIFDQIFLILNASTCSFETVLGHDWKEIFTVPWINPTD